MPTAASTAGDAPAAASSSAPQQQECAPLRDLVDAGVLAPGKGVLKVTWWGVELPPAADLSAEGAIRLPDGVGEAGATYTPTELLLCLAKHNRLFGFTKGNGWQAVSYGGRRLASLAGSQRA